jgi:hypothetical protein
MKKLIFILIITLIAGYITLSIFGLGGEYDAEKLYHKAMKNNYKITINPEVVPPQLLRSVENDLIDMESITFLCLQDELPDNRFVSFLDGHVFYTQNEKLVLTNYNENKILQELLL